MSTDSSTNSAALTNSEREDGARSCKSCKIKRLKALFCCVKRKPHKEIVEYDPDEYDYIVEKLVVKRVPLALFAIRADLLDGSDVTITPEQTSRSASSSTFGKRSNPGVSAVAWETISTKTTTDSNALNHRVKSSTWPKEILDRFSALYPDLKESERPPKDLRNFLRNKRLFVENVSETTSNARTNVFSKQMSSAIAQESVNRGGSIFGFSSTRMEKNDGLRQSRDASSKKDRNSCFPELNRKYIVSPFRVRRNSFDFQQPKSVDEDTGVNCKSLTYVGESVENKTLQLASEASKDCDLSKNTAVKWRITIRRQRVNADSEATAASEVNFLEKKNEDLKYTQNKI